jgi:hypothetical protein
MCQRFITEKISVEMPVFQFRQPKCATAAKLLEWSANRNLKRYVRNQ